MATLTTDKSKNRRNRGRQRQAIPDLLRAGSGKVAIGGSGRARKRLFYFPRLPNDCNRLLWERQTFCKDGFCGLPVFRAPGQEKAMMDMELSQDSSNLFSPARPAKRF